MADVSLEEIRANLFAALLSDCLDAAGSPSRRCRRASARSTSASVMVGRARTAVFMEVYHVADGPTRTIWRSRWSTACARRDPGLCLSQPGPGRALGELL